MSTASKVVVGIGLASWLIVVAAGGFWLTHYANTPGVFATTPVQWPVESSLQLAGDAPTMLLFLHPRCVYIRATLVELARGLEHASSPVQCSAVVYCPRSQPDAWAKQAKRRTLDQMHVQRILDWDGTEATRNGASTSGQVLLYSTNGKLIFSGGIPAGRGHEGDNAARETLSRILHGEAVSQSQFPVLSCPLQSPVDSDARDV